jgi:hypothetical protein
MLPATSANRPATTDVVYARDVSRAEIANADLVVDFDLLHRHLRTLEDNLGTLDDATLADMLRLAATPVSKLHPLVSPRTRVRMGLAADGNPPAGYALADVFDHVQKPWAGTVSKFRVLQQQLVNQLYTQFPGEEAKPGPRH